MAAIPNLNIQKPVDQHALADKYHLACTVTRNVKSGVTDCTYANSHGSMTRSMRTHLPPSPEGRDTLWAVSVSICHFVTLLRICHLPLSNLALFGVCSLYVQALSPCFAPYPFSGVGMKGIRCPKTLTFDRMWKCLFTLNFWGIQWHKKSVVETEWNDKISGGCICRKKKKIDNNGS